MYIWVISNFWLLWIVLLWIILYMSFLEPMYISLSSIYLGVGLLGHRLWKCLAFITTMKFFSISHFEQQRMRIPVASWSCNTHLLSVFFILTILVDEWYYLSALICISLGTTVIKHLFRFIGSLNILFCKVSIQALVIFFLNWFVPYILKNTNLLSRIWYLCMNRMFVFRLSFEGSIKNVTRFCVLPRILYYIGFTGLASFFFFLYIPVL